MFACRALLGVVTSLGLIAVGPLVAGMGSTVVMSDSMAPGVRAGDVVVVRSIPAADVRTGQVLLVDDPSFPGRLRLHRLVAERHGRYVLKGDANAQEDSATIAPQAVHGVGFLRVPFIGLPLLWLRTGRPLLALLALAALLVTALPVVLLDRGSGPDPAGLLRRPLAALRRAVLGAAVLLAVTVPLVGAERPAWAVFSDTTSSPGNSIATGTFACPPVPSPTPEILYSYTAASGTAEANLGSLGSQYDAALSTSSMRVGGTCQRDASAYVHFDGGESVVGSQPLPAGYTATQALWFSASAATGVLQDLGPSATAGAPSDRQLYFTSGGRLAYAMRDGGTVTTCAIAADVTLRTWHFAAAVYDSGTGGFTLYYDGSATSCSASVSSPSGDYGYDRLGSDTTIAADASSSPYRGDIDENAVWGSALSPSQIDGVRANGH